MKPARSAPLLLALLALPLGALANNQANVLATTGIVHTLDNSENKAPLTSGQTIGQGTVIVTGPNSNIVFEVGDNGKIVIGPNSRVRVGTFRNANEGGLYTLELILTRGTITGDATGAGASSLKVLTTCGVAQVAGSSFQIEFTPAGAAGGTFVVTSAAGLPSIRARGTVTISAVQPGTTVSITGDGIKSSTPQITQTPGGKINQIEIILTSNNSGGGTTPGQTTGTTPEPVQVIIRFNPTQVTSPNGSGIIITSA